MPFAQPTSFIQTAPLQYAIAGKQYAGLQVAAAGVGVFSYVQLWNPANSGVNVFLTSVAINVTLAVALEAVFLNAALANLGVTPMNKNPAMAAGGAQIRLENKAAAAETAWRSFAATPTGNAGIISTAASPTVLPPGWGVGFRSPTVNIGLTASLEWTELPV